MRTDPTHSVSVAGVIVDETGRALIVKRRDNGHWEPPGGVVDHNETIEDALRREVYEETGLKIESEGLTGVYQNMRRHIVALVFRCALTDGELVENPEVTAFRWVTAGDLPHLMDEAYAIRILDALTSAGSPAIRWHDGTNLI